jgi:hypothetical protein
MTQLTTLEPRGGFGATQRRDAWWLGPLLTFLGLVAFLVYGTWAAWRGDHFEIRQDPTNFHKPGNRAIAPYLTPFYAPLIYDPQSEFAWFKTDLRPSWLPAWFPFSAGFLILAFPGAFRLTCYYYRKAYYRAFWADPPACAVGEPRKSYWGENHWPLLFQNIHRYTLYFALIVLLFLFWEAIQAFRWPTNSRGELLPEHTHQFGMGLGTVIMVVNVILLAFFTFGCNSLRHLVGGRYDCFSCPHNLRQVTTGYRAWHFVTRFNERHALWAWLSLFSVGFTDLYIRLCSHGIWKDPRFF